LDPIQEPSTQTSFFFGMHECRDEAVDADRFDYEIYIYHPQQVFIK
jgi:hypothetical protein